VEVMMVVNHKKEIHRVSMGSSVDPDIWEQFKQHSQKTDIPISKLLDRAMKEFLERNKK
jgi:hypothetical protein